ncbi:DUF4129 domain-containing protein [Yoonia sp. F2084L]|uniref:DUF4129 domain-containing protein n=1 Tax=Yoonia sp. F2084L TaxID=2926419 RepID=UPI001FF36470|nr:DUF4129 domain-containing protein [Yoonia sp. F2084L]MCK0097298.1 DUF4129 domain-containing protein [Yoonia sp. F2084L]
MGFAPPVTAQHAALSEAEVSASGEAYLSAIRLRGVDSRVVYYDPTRPAPPLETTQALQSEREEDADGPAGRLTFEGLRVSTLVIASFILFGIVYLFVVFGGRLPVSFLRNPGDGGKAGHRQRAASKPGDAQPLAIDAVLRMADRRAALVALCKTLLARAVSAQGVLLQDSWTDRDALRSVPRSFAQRDALQALVFASERVQFGGRDVTEDEFRGHLDRLRPMLTQ